MPGSTDTVQAVGAQALTIALSATPTTSRVVCTWAGLAFHQERASS
ncbi:hypothetical protein [Nocardioides marmotae]|nr:hypothetical protein [Nocardioides marmotae]QKE00301.1 hypothetical protein HPC71_03800 [Nocardioides marmotae]